MRIKTKTDKVMLVLFIVSLSVIAVALPLYIMLSSEPRYVIEIIERRL